MPISDLFKGSEYRKKIAELTDQNQQLRDQAEEARKTTLTLQQLKPLELAKMIADKETEIKLAAKKVTAQKEKLAKINHDIGLEIKRLNATRSKLSDTEDEIMFESYGLYKPRYDFANSSAFKAQLEQTRANQKSMIRDGTAAVIDRPMLLDNSKAKGRSMQKKNIKQLLRAFNGECEAAINKVTKSNIETIEKRISRSYEQLNRLNEPNGVSITPTYFDAKIDEAHIALEYELKKEDEREQLREQREREREEKKLQQEIERERKKYEKDETHFLKVKKDVQEKIDNSDDQNEVDSLKAELVELQQQLDELKEKKEKLTNRAENPTAGYVYIISNIGSFGPNVFKIGVTRRLDPMERINELGSASVPFKFDVHALIFSDDAFKLETELHKHFAKQRINQVNSRKEYFNITIDEIKQVLEKYRTLTFDFHEVPEAEEFRESKKIREQQLSEKSPCIAEN